MAPTPSDPVTKVADRKRLPALAFCQCVSRIFASWGEGESIETVKVCAKFWTTSAGVCAGGAALVHGFLSANWFGEIRSRNQLSLRFFVENVRVDERVWRRVIEQSWALVARDDRPWSAGPRRCPAEFDGGDNR